MTNERKGKGTSLTVRQTGLSTTFFFRKLALVQLSTNHMLLHAGNPAHARTPRW